MIFAIFLFGILASPALSHVFYREILCGKIPELEGYHFFEGKSTVGTMRKFECLSGYRLEGMDSVTCTEEGQWKFGGTCLKKIIDCGPEPKCDAGFSMFDFSKICGEDGTWIAGWKCRKDCGELPTIKFGTISIGDKTFGSVREILCDPNYDLVGKNTLICDENGQWSEAPYCNETAISSGDKTEFIDFVSLDSLDDDSSSGSGENTNYEFVKPVVGNISCFEGNTSATNDTTANGYFYWPSDRCNGVYSCINGMDEYDCKNKCTGWRYPTRDDFVDCRAYIPMFYYDFETGKCEPFVWGGCADVINMFQSADECRRECDGVLVTKEATTTTTTTASFTTTTTTKASFEAEKMVVLKKTEEKTQVRALPVLNDALPSAPIIDESEESFSLDDDDTDNSTDVTVKPFENIREGNISCHPGDNTTKEFFYDFERCNGKYECSNGFDERGCRNKCYGWKYPSKTNFADCKASIPMYYYEIETGKCVKFEYGGCADIVNLFRAEDECKSICNGVHLESTVAKEITGKLKEIARRSIM